MDERDLEAEEPRPRLFVDQLRARVGEVRERAAQVVHLVGDVVHSRPALGQEPADGSVVAGRREQLDTARPDTNRSCLDALVRHDLAVLELGAEATGVGGQRLVEAFYW